MRSTEGAAAMDQGTAEMLEALQELEADMDSKSLRSTVEILTKIYKNISLNPSDKKYRELKLSNAKIQPLWEHEGSRHFLSASGWLETDMILVFPDDADVSVPLEILLQNRLVRPHSEEWTDHNKVVVQSRQRAHQDVLREKALAEKERDLKEFRKNKAEAEKIKAAIYADHRNDKEKNLFQKPAKASPLPKHDDVPEGSTRHQPNE